MTHISTLPSSFHPEHQIFLEIMFNTIAMGSLLLGSFMTRIKHVDAVSGVTTFNDVSGVSFYQKALRDNVPICAVLHPERRGVSWYVETLVRRIVGSSRLGSTRLLSYELPRIKHICGSII